MLLQDFTKMFRPLVRAIM